MRFLVASCADLRLLLGSLSFGLPPGGGARAFLNAPSGASPRRSLALPRAGPVLDAGEGWSLPSLGELPGAGSRVWDRRPGRGVTAPACPTTPLDTRLPRRAVESARSPKTALLGGPDDERDLSGRRSVADRNVGRASARRGPGLLRPLRGSRFGYLQRSWRRSGPFEPRRRRRRWRRRRWWSGPGGHTLRPAHRRRRRAEG